MANWHGWTAWLKWSGWKKAAAWPGWKKLFILHPLAVIALTLISAASLIWIFMNGMEESLPAYLIYCLSFYSLVILAVRIPALVTSVKNLADQNTAIHRYLTDEQFSFRVSLYFEQLINFVYGVFKIISGALLQSFWIGADGLYNLTQGIIQLLQILRRRKALSLAEQWKSYRLCGWLILVLHLTMTGLIFQMIHRDIYETYPGYMIFVTALFAFYKLISAFVDVARDRKHKAPVDSAVRLLCLSQALFSLFSLQVAMIHQFGGDASFAKLMNSLTGMAVCMMVVGIGVYMLRRSRRTLMKMEEPKDG